MAEFSAASNSSKDFFLSSRSSFRVIETSFANVSSCSWTGACFVHFACRLSFKVSSNSSFFHFIFIGTMIASLYSVSSEEGGLPEPCASGESEWVQKEESLFSSFIDEVSSPPSSISTAGLPAQISLHSSNANQPLFHRHFVYHCRLPS